MTTAELTRGTPNSADAARSRRAQITLAAATIGFSMITLDAVIVNVALPSMRDDLGGGVAGLQWVVDGYTLMFAGLRCRPASSPIASGRSARSASA